MIYFLLFLLFLTVTIEYRVDLGPLSVALVEPFALLFSGAVLLPPLIKKRQLFLKELLSKILNEPLVYLFVLMVVWALLIRPWAINWKNGLSDIRDWAIPAITFVAFLQLDYRDWRKWLGLFLLVVYLNSLLGIYQHLTDSGRPFVNDMSIYKKDVNFITGNEVTEAAFAAGLYSHPNQLGIYLFTGFMMALGWITSKTKLHVRFDVDFHWAKYLLLAPVLLALFWTYSKASLLVTGLAFGVWVLHHLIKPTKTFLYVLGGGAILGFIVIFIIQTFLPWAVVGSFLWRFGLWQIAFETMAEHPIILLFGNGLDLYALEAYHGQPHNQYVFALLQYGVIGLLITLAVAGRIWYIGLQARLEGLMERQPLLVALWIALLGFLIISIVETTWLALLNRLFFVLVMSIFLAIYKDINQQNGSMKES